MTTEEKYKIAIEKGITYNPETGEIIGIKGKPIGYKDSKGYLNISLKDNGKDIHIQSHTFAWFYIYGTLPKIIDHINMKRNDNRLVNLRSVTKQENSFNTKAKGYTFKKRLNKFEAKLKINNKTIYLGLHNTEDEAKAAYLAAKEKYHIINERD